LNPPYSRPGFAAATAGAAATAAQILPRRRRGISPMEPEFDYTVSIGRIDPTVTSIGEE